MEWHCHEEHEKVGVCITLRREDGLGCFAGALPFDLRASIVDVPEAWTETVRGAGALTFYAATYEDAHAAAGDVVRAIEDGALVVGAQNGGARAYWVLQESSNPASDIVVMFPHLYVLPALARALAQHRLAITSYWAVPYTGGEWRAVGGGDVAEGRLWSDPPPPGSSWLRTPRSPLTYALAASPDLVRIVTRYEPDGEAWWSADFRDVLRDSLVPVEVVAALTPEVALVVERGRRAALYRCHGERRAHGGGILWFEDNGCVEAISVQTWPDKIRRDGSVAVAPVSSTALECPAALQGLPRSAIGHVSFPAFGARWWAPHNSSQLRILQEQEQNGRMEQGRYENVGACDYITFVHGFRDGPADDTAVADDVRAMIERLMGPFALSGAVDTSMFSTRDAGAAKVTLLPFSAHRTYRPLLREAVAEFAKRRGIAMHYRHWIPLLLVPPFSADEKPHLVPRNRWGQALQRSLEWATVSWWPLAFAEPAYCDAQIAVWPGLKIARRFGEWVYTEYVDDDDEGVGTWEKAREVALPPSPRVRAVNADGAVYPGEQVVGTHALVRISWGGVCQAVPSTASLEDFSEDIDARLRRLQPSLNECRVLPTVVSERFGELVVPPSPGLTVVPMVAPCGAGKSTAAMAFARVLADQHWRVLFVSPRTSVVEQTIALLRGMHFSPIDGRSKEALASAAASAATCCVTTVHSLHRLAHTFIVPRPGAPRIALFFDEVATAFTSDYNSHIIPAAKCERALMSFLAGSVRMAVLMDANLTPHLVSNFVERYVYGVRKMVGSRLTHLSVAVHPKVATYNMVTLQRRSALCYTAFDAPLQIFRVVRERLTAGRKVAIFFSRKKDLDVWRRAMEAGDGAVRPEETFFYCADSKHPLGDLCARIQHGVRLFMYTSAAGAGVDLSFRDAAGDACEYFDTVAMVGASAPYLCPKDLEQAAGRVRMTTELLVDLAGADISGPLETIHTSTWSNVMNADETEVLARAMRTANCTSSLAEVVDLDRSEWLCARDEGGEPAYGDTSPYARLLAYNHLADRAVQFRCQAFVAILAKAGYSARVVPCPLQGNATLDSAALLLRAELMCDVEEGDDLYNHVLANRRRGELGLPPLMAGEPYVQRVEETIKRLYERDTLDVARTLHRLFSSQQPPSDREQWETLVKFVIREHGSRASVSTREDRQALGIDGVALREVLTSGPRGRKVLQVLGLYIATLAATLTGFFPLFEGTRRHGEGGFAGCLPLLGQLGQGNLTLTEDRVEWLRDANGASGALFVSKDRRPAATPCEVLNRYCISFFGIKVYRRTRSGFKVDDPNSRMALLSVVAPGEAAEWLHDARRRTVVYDRNVTEELPVESAPQSRKRKRLVRTESRLQLQARVGV